MEPTIMRRNWPALLLPIISAVAFSMTTTVPSLHSPTLSKRQFSGTMSRAAQFTDVPHINSRRGCEDVRPPQALATPDPLFTADTEGRTVKVSFIIGTDGRVHSPLILESSGMVGDRHVLRTVRNWRYRPATCNGVPTEIEGKIEFSSR
jgi:TonB family protein